MSPGDTAFMSCPLCWHWFWGSAATFESCLLLVRNPSSKPLLVTPHATPKHFVGQLGICCSCHLGLVMGSLSGAIACICVRCLSRKNPFQNNNKIWTHVSRLTCVLPRFPHEALTPSVTLFGDICS